MKFLNRKNELDHLSRMLNAEKASFAIIFGRRRIGKSTMIRKALKANDIYYMAQIADPTIQRQLLSQTISIHIPGFDSVVYPNWDSLFTNFSVRTNKRTTLCLDEFPYMVKTSPELPSVIQKWLDLNKNGKCNLIICGSSQQMMRGFAFDSSNPLYGRANEILKIEPLTPSYIQTALRTDAISAVEEYAIWGGVPRYWELREGYKDLKSAIIGIILDKFGVLHHEPVQLFLDDMRESVQAYSILVTIGSGANRISEIAARLNKPATQLSGPLDLLIQLGYVKREIPYGENPKNTKRSLYKISDPFLAFFFKIVAPNLSSLQEGNSTKVLEKNSELLKTHISSQWEELCRMAVSRITINEQEFNPAKRWWNGKVEFDIMTESLDGKTLLLGECKWSDNVDPNTIISQILKKVADNNLFNDKTIVPVAFVKSKQPTKEKSNIHCFTPENVMKVLE